MDTHSTLVVPLGSKPQLVTLAVDCLQEAGMAPGQVLVIHASSKREVTRQAIQVLKAEFAGRSDQVGIDFLELRKGRSALKDITSPEEVDIAFRTLYATVWGLKRRDRAVHLLIAGGRRTLTVFGMAVAQMLFEDRDHVWHIASDAGLEESGRLHAGAGEWARLIPIPVIPWGRLSPAFDILHSVNDPFEAAQEMSSFRLREQWDVARLFVLTKLTQSESGVVSLLVREGLNQGEIAERLGISLRTVEQHLRACYRKAEDHWEMEGVNQARLIRLLGLYFSTVRESGKLREITHDRTLLCE